MRQEGRASWDRESCAIFAEMSNTRPGWSTLFSAPRTASDRQMNRLQRLSNFPVALAYGVLVLLFFAPHLLGLAAFPDGDFNHHFLPFSLFQQDALLGLRLPVWDPYTNSGHPFLADVQSAVFYPVSNALLLLTGLDSSAAGRLFWLQVEAALHIFLACVFTYMLVHRLTGRRMAGFAAGAVFGFSGYLTGYPPVQLAVLRTAVWLPAILLLLLPRVGDASGEGNGGWKNEKGATPEEGLFRRFVWQWRQWLAAAAVHAVAFFGGHPQTFLFLSYAVGGWILMLRVVELRRRGRTGREEVAGARLYLEEALLFVGRAAAYVIFLAVLTLVQLWPAFEFTQLSVRSSLSFEALSGGFPLEDTWQILLPGILTQYSPQYVGIAALGLALVAVIALVSSRFSLPTGDRFARPAAIYFVVCGGVALLLSYGANGPLYGLFYRFAPLGYLFRGQERAIYLVAFALSALSGYGLALLPTLTDRQRRNLGCGFLAAVAVGAALFLLLWQVPARVDASSTEFLALGGKALLFAVAFAIVGNPRWKSGRRTADRPAWRTRLILLFPLLLVDLFVVNFATNLDNGPAIRSGLARAEADATLQAFRVAAEESDSLPARVHNVFRLPESSGQFVGWEDVYGSSPLRLAKYDTLFQDFPVERMWELTGTGTVLTWRQELFVDSEVVAEFPRATDTTFLHRLGAVTPRIWWAQAAQSVDDQTALTLLKDPGFDPKGEVLIDASEAGKLGDGWTDGRISYGSGGAAALDVERMGPAHLGIHIQSEQPGLLFISENWMPGWRATWNGQSQLPVVRAHQAFLGVPVPAGGGTLELAYRPISIRWGLAASVVGWAALFFALRQHLAAAALHGWRSARKGARELWRLLGQPAKGGSQVAHGAAPGDGRVAGLGVFSNPQVHRAGILAIILAGFALRLFLLDFQELRGDETFGFLFSLNSLDTIVKQTLALREPHPVGSYFLQHAWYLIAGTSEFALRSITALAGTAAIPLVFRLARQLRLGAPVALSGSLLMAASAYAIWHSQDARMYTLSLALTLATTVLALQVIDRRKNWPALAGYTLCAAAAMHVHYFAAFVILAQNLYVLFLLTRDFRGGRISGRRRSFGSALLVRWAIAQIAAVALSAPWLAGAWQTLVGYHGNGDSPAFGAMLWRSLGVFAVGETVPHQIWRFDGGILTAAVIAAGIVISLDGMRKSRRQGAEELKSRLRQENEGSIPHAPVNGHYPGLLLLLYLLIPLLATWISARERPIFNERYLIAALPPFLLLLAMGAARIGGRVEDLLGWRWRCWVAGAETNDAQGGDAPGTNSDFLARISVGHVAATGLILLTIAANVYSLRNYYYDAAFSKTRGWRELAATMERWSAGLPVDEVRFAENFPDPTIWYYYTGDVEHFVLPPGPHDEEGAAKRVEGILERGVSRVILPVQPAPNWDATGIAQEALASAYRLVAQEQVGAWPVQLYARPDPQLWLLFDVAFANGVKLERAQFGPKSAAEGGVLVIHMDWSGDPTTLTGGEKIFLHLIDESGNLVAQTDPELRMDSGELSLSVGLFLPPTLPKGALLLMAGLYDVTLEGAPRILRDDGTDSLLLSRFEEAQCDACGR